MQAQKLPIIRIFISACALLVLTSCQQEAEQKPIAIPQPGSSQAASYRVVAEAKQILKFEGFPQESHDLQGGTNIDRTEVCFRQRNQRVNEQGNIIAKITINALKLYSAVRDSVVTEFDSSGPHSQTSPLAKLIGQSYTIELSPAGRFVQVADAAAARNAVKGASAEHNRAQSILSNEAIQRRHGLAALPGRQLAVNDRYSSVTSFHFPLLGTKAYERVYTVTRFDDRDGRKVAIIEMAATPTTASAEGLNKDEVMTGFADKLDHDYTYNGLLQFDTTNGLVEHYSEELSTEWVFADPTIAKDQNAPVPTIVMGAVRSYTIDRIE